MGIIGKTGGLKIVFAWQKKRSLQDFPVSECGPAHMAECLSLRSFFFAGTVCERAAETVDQRSVSFPQPAVSNVKVPCRNSSPFSL
jgi:hypothetical protein